METLRSLPPKKESELWELAPQVECEISEVEAKRTGLVGDVGVVGVAGGVLEGAICGEEWFQRWARRMPWRNLNVEL